MASVTDIQQFVNTCWREVLSTVHGAAVYIDHEAAECFHWYTGDKAYSTLMNAGAESVHELAMYNFRYMKVKDTKRAVIISTSASSAFYQRTIKMIMEKNAFERCIIVCTADSSIIDYPLPLSAEDRVDYNKLKRDVKEWMNNKDSFQECFVEVIYKPIFVTFINENVFVTPTFWDLMPPLDGVVATDMAATIDHLVCSFNSLFAHLNVKKDIYAMGKFSEYIADQLENLSINATRANSNTGTEQQTVSLILVDRTLDLCSATSNASDSMLGRILFCLPRLPYHHNDVEVDMSPLLIEAQSTLPEAVPSLHIAGCLASKDTSTMNILISKKQKDVLFVANQILSNVCNKESPVAKLASRISVHSLEKIIHKIRDTADFDSIAVSSKKLQAVLAVIQASKSDKTCQLELLASLEKLVLQNLAISRDSSSILSQISNIIKTRTTRGLDMEDLLALLIHIYALAGTEIHFSEQQTQQLQEAIASAIFEDIKMLMESAPVGKMTVYQQTLVLLGVSNEGAAEETSMKIAEHIMNTLLAVAEQRAALTNYASLIRRTSSQEIVQCIGVLERLVMDLFSSDKQDIPDLCPRSSRLISTGFNLFLKGRKKYHPSDNSWIIIYVIGGITPEECRRVQEIATASKTNCRVTLGGSCLLSSLDVVDKIVLSTVAN